MFISDTALLSAVNIYTGFNIVAVRQQCKPLHHHAIPVGMHNPILPTYAKY